ncbi:hypothetical protein IJJ39_01915 [Candidatus Saccharibacteria bacterium]|nr:hypothetical protein [Candidatus Saccharibacteria bacterium]
MIIFSTLSLQTRFAKAVAFQNDFVAQLGYDGVDVHKSWLPPVVEQESSDALKKGIKTTFNRYWAARRWLARRHTGVSQETKDWYDAEARLLETLLLFGDDNGILQGFIDPQDFKRRPEVQDLEEEAGEEVSDPEEEYVPPFDEYRLADASDVIPDDYDGGYYWDEEEDDEAPPLAVSA